MVYAWEMEVNIMIGSVSGSKAEIWMLFHLSQILTARLDGLSD